MKPPKRKGKKLINQWNVPEVPLHSGRTPRSGVRPGIQKESFDSIPSFRGRKKGSSKKKGKETYKPMNVPEIPRISRCPAGTCIWWRSWTGTVEKSSPGAFPTPWMLIFVSRPSTRPSDAMGHRKSSTPIKGVNLPVPPSRGFSIAITSISGWTAADAFKTTSSSSGFGGHSSIITSISGPSTMALNFDPDCGNGLSFTIKSALIKRLTI